jgi:hypothetical protein
MRRISRELRRPRMGWRWLRERPLWLWRSVKTCGEEGGEVSTVADGEKTWRGGAPYLGFR